MTEPSASQEPKIIDATVVRSHTTSSRARLPWLVLALAFAALAGAGGFYYQSTRTLQGRAAQSDSALADLRARIDALGTRLEAAGDDAANAEQFRHGVQQSLEELREQQTALAQEQAKSLAMLAQTQTAKDDSWILREVHYLLTVAEQRLRLERDVPTATAAVESADRRLGESDDPVFIPIREQIIADLNALRAVPAVDITGMTLTLASLIDRADTLPLKGGDIEKPGVDAVAAAETSAATGDVPGWRGALQDMWKDLISLVDVKSMGVPDDVIFDPGKRYLLQQNLRLELAAARLETLRHDTGNLRATLQRIDVLLDRYYEAESAAVAAVRAALAPMHEVELAPALPSLEQSLQLVRAQLEAQTHPARVAPAE